MSLRPGNSMKKRRIAITLLLLGFLASSCPLQAQEEGGIVFLRLALRNGTVSLVGCDVRPGTLKGRSGGSQAGGLVVDVRAANGRLLWSGSIPDPLVRRYEYEDPAQPGSLKPVVVTRDSAEFSVRIPYFAETDRVEFSGPESGGATGERRSLGSVRPVIGGGVR